MQAVGQKLCQRIAATLAKEIEQDRYAPGARLPGERELAEDLGVSRPTIREAMIALEIRGLVESRHGSGIYVTKHKPKSFEAPELDVGAFELIEARILFEGEAAALAATVIGDEALARLDAILQQMSTIAPETDEARAADREFHLLIAEATGNTLVHSVVEMLWNVRERSPLCIHMFAQAQHEGVKPRVDQHRLLVDALRARDQAAARETMRDHLRRVTDDLLSATELELIERARAEAEERRQQITRRGVR